MSEPTHQFGILTSPTEDLQDEVADLADLLIQTVMKMQALEARVSALEAEIAGT